MSNPETEYNFKNSFEKRFDELLASMEKIMDNSIQSIKSLFTVQHAHLEEKIESVGAKVDSYIESQEKREEARAETKAEDTKTHKNFQMMLFATVVGWILMLGGMYVTHLDSAALIKVKEASISHFSPPIQPPQPNIGIYSQNPPKSSVPSIRPHEGQSSD